jgi:two-component system, NtrC family, C4-dicarboxylate transport sensor histidine kinase DctB
LWILKNPLKLKAFNGKDQARQGDLLRLFHAAAPVAAGLRILSNRGMIRFPKISRAVAISLFLALVTGFTGFVAWVSLRDGLDRLAERGAADLSLASGRLTGELQRYRELAVFFADHPTLMPLAFGAGSEAGAANALLLAAADRTGSDRIELVGRDGRVLASSERGRVAGGQGELPEYLQRALNGTIGFGHMIDPVSKRRMFVYASPVFSPQGPVLAAVTIRLDVETVEAVSRGEPEPAFFTDSAGVVFVSNRDELVLRGRGAIGEAFPPLQSYSVAGHVIWAIEAGPYLPALALHLTRPLPVIAMQGEILLDAMPVLQAAAMQAATAAALCLIFGVALFTLSERRRMLAARLEAEARANIELEERVAARTKELTLAQADLIRAGKLSALGQMSAGLSHELNQPLMAIRSYAENAAAYIERGKAGVAAENLLQISDLARRMGRIIRNLRAFARQEVEGFSDVDLVAAVAAVLEITQPRMRQDGVVLDYEAPASAVMVRGGEVRLQQVVLNLIANALDAMAGQAGGRLHLWIEADAARVRLHLRDSGSGISEPEKMFDPFYSTKAVGQAEGMGLGLSISYGIIESFGGSISGRNPEGGGAEFCVELIASGGQKDA